MSADQEKKETYLEADKEIPGQHYVCLSFISPQKVLQNKDIYFFSEFLKDYEIQYKIRATETFVMAQAAKLQEAASKVQDLLENLKSKESIVADDVNVALEVVKGMRGSLTQGTSADLEKHVKAEMSDFKLSTIQEAYDTYLYKHKKRLESDFYAKNEFRTTVQGLKVRGTFDTYNEALARAKTLQKIDPSFNVYVGQVGFWLPWDPEPHEVADQEYADDQLNTLMKKYKENEEKRDEFYAENKREKLKGATVRDASRVGTTQKAEETEDGKGNMFAGEDLAIARKRELAEEQKDKNTISHA